MFLVFGAFVAGILTVLAPCVLPLLPIIIGGSVAGDTKDRRRPFIIAASLAVSLVVFTLLLKATTLLINIPPSSINYVSGSIIVLLGAVLLFPTCYIKAVNRLGIEKRAQGFLGKGFRSKGHFVGPIIIGAALGPVFSSCSPVYAYILASVLPAHFGRALVYIVAYVLGLSAVLLLVGYYGQRFTSRIRFASNPKGWFQRSVAILFIAVGILVFTSWDVSLQTWASEHTPFDFNGISSKLLPASKHPTTNSSLFNVQSYAAPNFVGLQNWINSPPLTMQQLRGKVVLVDFWTYSCINCIRNDKYVEQWYKAYQADGLVVVGVSAPEFAFEQVPANVQKAVASMGLTYPIALDNQLQTWSAFNNDSWPASYLINPSGQVVRVHSGEGDYTDEEQAIRTLLTENGARLSGSMVTNTSDNTVPISQDQTPETYFGLERASGYEGAPDLGIAQTETYTPYSPLDTNAWTLSGTWEEDNQYIVARGNSTLSFHVATKNVYVVGSSTGPAAVSVDLDGKPISQTGFAGSDIVGNTLTMNGSRLYNLLAFPNFSSSHTVTLHVPNGVELNTFTFGS